MPLDTEFPPSAYILPKNVVQSVFQQIEDEETPISSWNILTPLTSIPKLLLPHLHSVKDWNYRNI